MNNYPHGAIWTAVVVQFIVRYFIYSPQMFLNPWLEGLNLAAPPVGAWDWQYLAISIIASAVYTYFLAWLMEAMNIRSGSEGARLGSKVWSGFLFPAVAVRYAFMGVGLSTYAVDALLMYVNSIVAGWLVGRARK